MADKEERKKVSKPRGDEPAGSSAKSKGGPSPDAGKTAARKPASGKRARGGAKDGTPDGGAEAAGRKRKSGPAAPGQEEAAAGEAAGKAVDAEKAREAGEAEAVGKDEGDRMREAGREEAAAGEADGKAVDAEKAREAGEEMSEEEFRRLVEESLEKVTVAEVAFTMMNQLASMGYLKMGLPESVNLKYRDFEQAALAIDLLEAMIKGAEGRMSEELLRPFRGTLANLQMNFVQLRRR
ncbi:MAG: hypothetical protein H5T74_02265 [Actinobacteria bacterium]|nr:hypothetical protein [Actinomycetota bacterium]